MTIFKALVRARRPLVMLALAVIMVLVFTAPLAYAETPGTGWEVTSTTFPTNLAPAGGTGTLQVDVYNIGARPSQGTVTVTGP